MTATPGGYLSFLDLTCCGFGCALLLFLLMAAATPQPARSKPRNLAMVVHCFREDRDGPGPKPPIRIQCKRPGSNVWERADQIIEANPSVREMFEFHAPAQTIGGCESFLIFYAPEDGLWAFRAYIETFATTGPLEPIPLKFEVLGEGVELVEGPQQSPIFPGGFTNPVEVLVSRKP